jgi:hypothetical protein
MTHLPNTNSTLNRFLNVPTDREPIGKNKKMIALAVFCGERAISNYTPFATR